MSKVNILAVIHDDLRTRLPHPFKSEWTSNGIKLTGPQYTTPQELQALREELKQLQGSPTTRTGARFWSLHYFTHGQIPPIYVRIQGEHLLVGEHILELANPRSMDQMDQILREAGIPLAIPIKSENG